MWGSTLTNNNGLTIINSLEDLNLSILNDGTPTRFTPPNQNRSAVDLTLVTSNIATYFSWEVINDCGNSDHFPIICSSNNSLHFSYTIPYKRRIFKKAKWEIYYDFINSHLDITSYINYDLLENIINDAAEMAIPYSQGTIQIKKTLASLVGRRMY